MVAAKNLEPTPDRVGGTLNGLRCQGFSEKYLPIKQAISPLISRSEVVLIKVDRSDWLSLRPWFLYFWEDDRESGNDSDELGLLNIINDRHFNYIGLFSGREYRVGEEWRSFTMYGSELLGSKSASKDKGEDGLSSELVRDDTQNLISQLVNSSENIIVQEQIRAGGKEYMVSVRTPAREVAVAMVDEHGEVHLFRNMLERAVGEGIAQWFQVRVGVKGSSRHCLAVNPWRSTDGLGELI